MSEPRARARSIRRVVPGILNWHLLDDRIASRSDAWAVQEDAALVLVDPLPLDRRSEAALERLGSIAAICLTGSCHQRSAWRYRGRFGARVLAPEGAEGLEERPDAWFRPGDELPGGLTAIHTPGPTEVHYSFHRRQSGGAVFCADLLVNGGVSGLRFVPSEYQDDPARTRVSARGLLSLEFRTICFAHGGPATRGAKAAIRAALAADAGGRA